MSKNSKHSNSTNFFQRFFWFCSGVDIDLLTGKYEQFPTPLKAEYNKYIGIGTAVFFTSIFAFVSGTFAISFMPNSKWWFCILFGLIWGLNIFFLDRYMVSTMRKGDKEWSHAFPRIAIGLLFAFTIAVPLELTLFDGKVQDELSKYNTSRVSGCEEECNSKIKELNKQITVLDSRLSDKQKEQPRGYKELINQKESTQVKIKDISNEISRNRRIIRENRSPNPSYPYSSNQEYTYNEKAERYQTSNRRRRRERSQLRNTQSQLEVDIKNKFEKFETEIAQLSEQIEQQKKPLKQEVERLAVQCPLDIAECQKIAKGNTDLLSRYDALSRAKGSWFSSIWLACSVIQFLFVFLELAPILSKIISHKGSYDVRLESIEALERLEASKQNNEINEHLLDIETDNEKRVDARKFSIEEDRFKLATRLFKTEQREELEKDKIRRENYQKQQEAELSSLAKYRLIDEQLTRKKSEHSKTINEILDENQTDKKLDNRVAEYITDKQFESLKQEIDSFFDKQWQEKK